MNAREDAPVTHLEYLLTAYLFESLSEAGRREVEEHLGRCPACRRELEELRATLGMVRDVIAPGGEASPEGEAQSAPVATGSSAGTSSSRATWSGSRTAGRRRCTLGPRTPRAGFAAAACSRIRKR